MSPRLARRLPLPSRLLRALLLLLALGLGGCHAMLFGALNSTDRRQGIEALHDIDFGASPGLALDVYRPPHAEHAPIVVFFYGGDWTHGQRQWYRFVGSALAARGVVTVIPDYRKYPQVRMDGFMADGARALAWTFAHASQLGGNPQDIFVMGHSAGGQIAALLATDPAWLQPYGLAPANLAGLIGLAGCYDFVPIPAFEKDMLGTFGHATAEQRLAEPISFVDGHEPPALLLQGTADTEVDPDNARSLAAVMSAHGDAVTLKLYPGVGHSPLLFALSRPMRGHAPTLADILAFIQAHPQAAQPPLIQHPPR